MTDFDFIYPFRFSEFKGNHYNLKEFCVVNNLSSHLYHNLCEKTNKILINHSVDFYVVVNILYKNIYFENDLDYINDLKKQDNTLVFKYVF